MRSSSSSNFKKAAIATPLNIFSITMASSGSLNPLFDFLITAAVSYLLCYSWKQCTSASLFHRRWAFDLSPRMNIFLSFPRSRPTGSSPVPPPPQVCSSHTPLSLLLPFRRWGGRWTGAGQGAHPANCGEAHGQVQSQGGRDAAAVLCGRRGETSCLFFPIHMKPARNPSVSIGLRLPSLLLFKGITTVRAE